MHELAFLLHLKHTKIEFDKVIFQHEENILLQTPKKVKSPLESTLDNLFGEDDDQLGLILSLRKLFERNKKVKSL